jgi:hypothetical protein
MQLVKGLVLNNATLESLILVHLANKIAAVSVSGGVLTRKYFQTHVGAPPTRQATAPHLPTMQNVVSRRTCLLGKYGLAIA